MRVPSTLPNIEEGKRGTQNRFHGRPLPPPHWGRGTLSWLDAEKNVQRHASRSVWQLTLRSNSFTMHAPPPRLIPLRTIHHSTQSQAACHTAKTLVRMFIRNLENLVATGQNA